MYTRACVPLLHLFLWGDPVLTQTPWADLLSWIWGFRCPHTPTWAIAETHYKPTHQVPTSVPEGHQWVSPCAIGIPRSTTQGPLNPSPVGLMELATPVQAGSRTQTRWPRFHWLFCPRASETWHTHADKWPRLHQNSCHWGSQTQYSLHSDQND